jgi:hypothetical protein
MAKRRSREQIDADKIIKEYLNELGEKVYQQATETSERYRRLQDEQNYRVQPDTVLTFGQWFTDNGTTQKELQAKRTLY